MNLYLIWEERMRKRKSHRKSNRKLELKLVQVLMIALFLSWLTHTCWCDYSKKMSELDYLQKSEQKIEAFKPIQWSKEEVNQKEEKQLKAMLGRLSGLVSESELAELKQLHHSVLQIIVERERKGNFKESKKEKELWEKITGRLDRLTSFYLQEDHASYQEEGDPVDYGQQALERLKTIITKQDLEEIEKYRAQYFQNEDRGKKEDNGEIQLNMSEIVRKYPQLNQEIVLTILLEPKNIENQAVYLIDSNLEIECEDEEKVGLDKISEEEDVVFKEYWEAIKDIIPAEILEHFSYIKMGSDGEYGIYAYVMRMDGEGKQWCLNFDPADYNEDGEFAYTIIHEMAHYLSLNEKQVQYYTEDNGGFPSYRFSDEECLALRSSYLQKFYLEFWEDITPVWKVNPEGALFYNRHKEEFVTPYASTSCTEDFAESFCAYVLMKNAPTPETREKFIFFDGILELKEMKEKILQKVEQNQVIIRPTIN